MNLTLRPAAVSDLQEAFDWYEAQRPGLGEEFLVEVDSILDAIREHPGRFRDVYRGVRQALLRRFPYRVLYLRQETTEILVIACFHARRSPRWIRGRI